MRHIGHGTLCSFTPFLLALVCVLATCCDRRETSDTIKGEARVGSLPAATQHPDSAAGPRPAVHGIDENGRLRFSEQDRCPVCAMKVKNHPKFACGIKLKDGRTFYFCGTGCMIRCWLHPESFLGVERQELQRAVVQDYFEGQHVDALSVMWVAGSDVVGPMGPAIVPVRNERELDVFRQRHGGTISFRLADLDDDKWESITGKKAVP